MGSIKVSSLIEEEVRSRCGVLLVYAMRFGQLVIPIVGWWTWTDFGTSTLRPTIQLPPALDLKAISAISMAFGLAIQPGPLASPITSILKV